MLDYQELFNKSLPELKADPSITAQIISSTSAHNVQFTNLKHRLWHLINNTTNSPKCSWCNQNDCNWLRDSHKYSLTCSKSCKAKLNRNNPDVSEKRIATNMKRYGGNSPASSNIVRDKMNETLHKHYEQGMLSPEIVNARRSTNLSKYGVDNPAKHQVIKDKVISTNLLLYGQQHFNMVQSHKIIAKQEFVNKFGVDNPMKLDQIKQKCNDTMLSRYGVVRPLQNPAIVKKAKETFFAKYGANSIWDVPEIRAKVISTHHLRYNRVSNSQSHISEDSLNKLDNKDWMIQHHITQRLTLTQIAADLSVNVTTVANYMAKHCINTQLYGGSAGERELVEFIQSVGILGEMQTNSRTIIPPFELDVYLPAYKIAIEYCGLYWHSDAHERITPMYHKHKHDLCKAVGIRLITIYEDEWIGKRQLVQKKLLHLLKLDNSAKIHARGCSVVQLSSKEKDTFFAATHIQGAGPGSITYALRYEGDYVAAITFINKGNGKYVLNRYSTNSIVQGGFTKLLQHFKRHNDWSVIETFADLRWSDGALYSNNGFKHVYTLLPDYYWILNGSRYHKFNWRHSNKLKSLPRYDSALSESANMRNHNAYKIYNCGLMKFEMHI